MKEPISGESARRHSKEGHEAKSGSVRKSAVAFELPSSESKGVDGSRLSGGMDRLNSVTSRLRHSQWYRSAISCRIRRLLHGDVFSAMMVGALVIALFAPELFLIIGVSTDVELDIMLSMAGALFIVELVFLSAVDATYFLSFFFVMDLFGTISMSLDITYMFGNGASMPRAGDDVNAMHNTALLRATRAARIGARAGRLARALRLFRFLPFILGHNDKLPKTGLAVVINAQLANSVATRVAKLTIFLVLVVPLFDIMSFPRADYSLQTWVDRLSELRKKNKLHTFHREVNDMADFYSGRNYGPYKVCHGSATEEGHFVCEQVITSWKPKLDDPPRLSSALLIHSDAVLVAFNMHGPAQLDSCLATAMIIFMILSMVFSGFTLSNITTQLAVRPLERMLLTVRQIASTVFKFSQEVGSDDQGDEQHHPNLEVDTSSSEMELLERVVQKLAIIADLQTSYGRRGRISVVPTKDMQDEDIAILSMLQGKFNIVEEAAKQNQRISTSTLTAPPRKKALLPGIRLEDFGMSQELYQSWAFNSLPLSKSQKTTLAIFTISRFHDGGDGFIRTQEEETTLQRFIQTMEKEYLPNPFHNFSHAVDVTHVVGRHMRLIRSENFLTDLEQFSLLIAASAHDLGHPGLNNGFLSEVGHELALQYNDRSPLENMHCFKLYSIVGHQETNVFGKMSREQYKECRKHCIETILHTDMMAHQSMVKDLQMIYQMNSEVFTNVAPDQVDGTGSVSLSAEMEVFSQNDVKTMVMNTILHSADVSNPCRSWEVSQAWAFNILDEYFAQGDQEKMLGIPVQFLNDRVKLNKPNSQIGFIEFMIAPFFAAQIRLWPPLFEFGDNLVHNNACWEELWVKEVSPAEDERQKVRLRVEKVKQSIEDAKSRGGAVPRPQKTDAR